jgi:hypothetical protein
MRMRYVIVLSAIFILTIGIFLTGCGSEENSDSQPRMADMLVGHWVDSEDSGINHYFSYDEWTVYTVRPDSPYGPAINRNEYEVLSEDSDNRAITITREGDEDLIEFAEDYQSLDIGRITEETTRRWLRVDDDQFPEE